MFAVRIACIGRSVGWPAGRFFHSFFLMSARRLRSMCVYTYIHLASRLSRKQFAVKAVDRDETESWQGSRACIACIACPSVLPILRDYLSGVSQQPLILTGNELRTLNVALISILRDLQIHDAHSILRMPLSLSTSSSSNPIHSLQV